jgi:uncharacterized membrane protein (DUF2068 family)
MPDKTIEIAPEPLGPCDAPPRSQTAATSPKRANGLALIAAYKVVHAVFLFCLGLVALRLVHKDLADELISVAMRLHFNPEGHFIHLLLSRVSLVDAHRLRQIGFFTFADSVLALVEGVGLFYQKAWAEYLTILVTASFVPWELFELVRHASPFRLVLLLLNLAVLGYLTWLLAKKKARSAVERRMPQTT